MSGTSWGGHTGENLWLNVFQWYWAIAERGTPADVEPASLATVLAVSLEDAARIIVKADRYFRSMGRTNHRTGYHQRLARNTRKELRELAGRRGIKTTGWDLKAELIDRLVDHEYPLIRDEKGDAV